MVIGRLSDFFSFNSLLFFRMRRARKDRYDLVLCTTSPPLVAHIALKAVLSRKIPFCYWAMDLQPELSIASGLIKDGSFSARALTRIGNFIIQHSSFIFALDVYMKDYLVRRGAIADNVHVVPVWPVMEKIYEGGRAENPFRIENGFGGKTVVMYSGNHSYVHPLDTLLQTALALREEKDFLFVFIGGGVRKKDVTAFKEKNGLNNIVQLPYQPRNNIHNSLGAADLQVVIMGDGQVGFTHPNKVYGAMFIGKPILYIGPSPSHITDILSTLKGNLSVTHGDAGTLTQQLLQFGQLPPDEREAIGQRNAEYARQHFYPAVLKERMLQILEAQIEP
jgi:glycosyltransferase involved in cell wall biosynthesis